MFLEEDAVVLVWKLDVNKKGVALSLFLKTVDIDGGGDGRSDHVPDDKLILGVILFIVVVESLFIDRRHGRLHLGGCIGAITFEGVIIAGRKSFSDQVYRFVDFLGRRRLGITDIYPGIIRIICVAE